MPLEDDLVEIGRLLGRETAQSEGRFDQIRTLVRPRFPDRDHCARRVGEDAHVPDVEDDVAPSRTEPPARSTAAAV